MSVVDFLLNSLIVKLKKTQKARKRSKIKKRKSQKRPRRRISTKKKIKRRPSGPAKKLSFFKKPPQRKPKKSGTKGKKKSRAPHKTQTAKKKAAKPAQTAVKETCVGEITHFFSRISVVVVKMTGGRLNVGETIHILGKGTDFTQKVGSLQIESVDVRTARKGQLVGLKVNKVAKVGSKVYKSRG